MRLEDLENKLLDLGKRNRLLNYKETGFKSISILNKNYKEIYEGLTNGKEYSFMIVDPMLERYHKTFAIEEGDNILEYSPLKVYDICKEAIKPNELLAYKKGYKLNKTLKNLMVALYMDMTKIIILYSIMKMNKINQIYHLNR